MKCFDPKGNEFDKHPVDAQECVAVLGWTLEPQPAKVKAEKLVKVKPENAKTVKPDEKKEGE